ncbi:hypothetical protein BC937DRAFT_89024 [Endogone sp. FLAS-F59071]|nr:hypothetical protein BC937DRAFT_89024 [Endogone sp. FLAS-F59071]|eukprot:RUS22459.1 hypothetical protein BC937DRAFT_89024 [Endogone sp. FLAS-F59071]
MGGSSKRDDPHRSSTKRRHERDDDDDDDDDDRDRGSDSYDSDDKDDKGDKGKRRSSSSSKKDKKDRDRNRIRKESGKDKKKSSRKHHKRNDHDDRDDDDKSGSEDELVKQAKALIKLISEEDYYAKATEFKVWLHEEKNKFFDELTSEQAHEQFKKFVKAWNKFKLDKKYYSGIRSSQIASSDTTRYKWKFASKIDREQLETVKDSVDSLTNKELKSATGTSSAAAESQSTKRRVLGPTMPPPSVGIGIRGPGDDEDMDDEDRARYARALRKKEQRSLNRTNEAALDEIAPRETGRHALLAKRRAQKEFHKRERSPNVELPESFLMGGDDFEARLAAEKRSQQAREERRTQRNRDPALGDKLAALQSKESETMAMFRKMAEEQKKKGGLHGMGAGGSRT